MHFLYMMEALEAMANVIQLLCTAPCWVADKNSIYIPAEGHEHQISITRTERSLSAGRRELERSYPGRGALSLLSPLIDCGWCVVLLMLYLGWALLNDSAAEKKVVSSRYSKLQSAKRGGKQKVAERCFDVKARARHNQGPTVSASVSSHRETPAPHMQALLRGCH
jgi:hypothetical protein